MKNKKLIVCIIFLIGLFMTIPSFATEMVETLDLTPKNYYKLREEVYGNNKKKDPTKFTASFNSGPLPIKEYLISEALKQNPKIDVSQYSISRTEMSTILLMVLDAPEMYSLGTTVKYSYNKDTGIVLYIEFVYLMTTDEYEEAQKIIDKSKDIYLEGIQPEWNDLEKIVYTNNFLCQYCTYATNIIETSHSIYGALVDRLPVSDGYAKAFKYLINEVGVNAVIVTSFDMEHAWNMVEYNGDYYHLDVTWNDDDDGVGTTTYRYFMTSDQGFQDSNRNHYSWIAENSIKGNNTQFDGTNTPWGIDFPRSYLMYKDNYWYSLDFINKVNYINIRKQSLRNLSDVTTVKKDTPDYVFIWPGYATDGDYIYFTTQDTITKVGFDGQGMQSIYMNPYKGSKVLFSIAYIENKFYFDTLDIVNNAASMSTRDTSELNYIPIRSVTIDQKLVEMDVGDEIQLTATITPDYVTIDKTLTWTSSDSSIATVDQNGNVMAEAAGNVVITVTTSNGKKDTCSVTVFGQESSEEIIYTNYDVIEVGGKEVIVFPAKTNIWSTLIIDNYPVLGNGYLVKIYTSDDVYKGIEQYYGSRNYIRLEKDGNIEKEYIAIVNGDINGDGNAMLYDAFQILKGTILPGTVLDDLDKLIRDSNNDGFIMLYDAFQFLKRSILGI